MFNFILIIVVSLLCLVIVIQRFYINKYKSKYEKLQSFVDTVNNKTNNK